MMIRLPDSPEIDVPGVLIASRLAKDTLLATSVRERICVRSRTLAASVFLFAGRSKVINDLYWLV